MDTSSVHLPDEIIELILSKCHVKSVVRFKSVSKSWQCIISDPRFPRIHPIQRSKLREDQNMFFLRRWEEQRGLYRIRFKDEKFQTNSESLLGYPSSGKFFEPFSSCDGLILLFEGHKEYMLWNPLMRKHIVIPTFDPMTHPQAFRKWINSYPNPWMRHLYHDSITDDYKIVFLYQKCYTVYSCKNGSWGEIKDFRRDWDIHDISREAAVDGCLYGIPYYSSEIKCFDARDGKLHKFRQPNGAKRLRNVKLEAVSGRLCLYGYQEEKLQFWVMEKNGSLEKSWKKLISMKEKEEPYIMDMSPVYLTDKDDVVLRVRRFFGPLFWGGL